MNLEMLKAGLASSPAFVIDRDALLANLHTLAELRRQCGVRVLYSIKALPLTPVMQIAKTFVDGFSVSSLFEAKLAHEVLAGEGGIHLTTPGMRPDQVEDLRACCSHIAFNSLSQFERLSPAFGDAVSLGLRINPKQSALNDARFDPCRPHSKLGITLKDLQGFGAWDRVAGLHVHNSFSATSYAALRATLQAIEAQLGDKLGRLDWLNLGGGYLYGRIDDHRPFIELVKHLSDRYGAKIYIEPGKAIIGNAAHLVATVIDIFDSDGKTVAILDTSVNHHPEIFEYQRQPALAEHRPGGACRAILAGSSCLAGDLFGEYRFERPLKIGDRVVFTEVGAYSLVKANRFNGHNLPDIYLADGEKLACIKRFGYEDFRRQWHAEFPI